MDLKDLNTVLIGEGLVWHSRPPIHISQKSFIGRMRKKFKLPFSFTYPIFNLLVPVHNENVLRSLEKGFFLSLKPKDYLNSKEASLKEKFLEFIGKELNYTCDQIWLQTLPRMFGYVFNPVSFWYCYREGKLDSVLCEVNNTFGDKHFYFIKDVDSSNAKIHQTTKKFHVSPFLDIKGHYTFKFTESEKENEVSIQLFNKSELKISTKIKLHYQLLEKYSSLYILRKYGWMTLMVIIRIHVQALVLWMRGADFFKRPSPPKENITYEYTTPKQSSSI